MFTQGTNSYLFDFTVHNIGISIIKKVIAIIIHYHWLYHKLSLVILCVMSLVTNIMKSYLNAKAYSGIQNIVHILESPASLNNEQSTKIQLMPTRCQLRHK